jgi:uncharacterized membrane protein YhhN
MDALLRNSGPAFGVALALAVWNWVAVARNWRRAEYASKPATLAAVTVAAWLITRGPHDAHMAQFFLPGLALSLAGDIFLMLPGERFFVSGLASFLLAHVCYIMGLNPSLPPLPAFTLLAVIAAWGVFYVRGLSSGLRKRGQTALLVPIIVYSLMLSLLLLSAWATLFRPSPPWTPWRRAFVIAGATLFFASDSLLAWNRFVGELPFGRTTVMITYHLAQFGLAASIALV